LVCDADRSIRVTETVFRYLPGLPQRTGVRILSRVKKNVKNILTKDLFIDILSFSSVLLLKKHKHNFWRKCENLCGSRTSNLYGVILYGGIQRVVPRMYWGSKTPGTQKNWIPHHLTQEPNFIFCILESLYCKICFTRFLDLFWSNLPGTGTG